MSQDEINRILVGRAREGKVVCRLKGGDPFVFGRGGEEAEALAEAGIPFEVVPGVSSAVAVPAYAGIPLTHRRYASSFAVITGNEAASKPESSTYWSGLAGSNDTLVFLMGVKNLETIAQRLMEHGKSPETPSALIRWGTRPEQQTVVAPLGRIAQAARGRQHTAACHPRRRRGGHAAGKAQVVRGEAAFRPQGARYEGVYSRVRAP